MSFFLTYYLLLMLKINLKIYSKRYSEALSHLVLLWQRDLGAVAVFNCWVFYMPCSYTRPGGRYHTSTHCMIYLSRASCLLSSVGCVMRFWLTFCKDSPIWALFTSHFSDFVWRRVTRRGTYTSMPNICNYRERLNLRPFQNACVGVGLICRLVLTYHQNSSRVILKVTRFFWSGIQDTLLGDWLKVSLRDLLFLNWSYGQRWIEKVGSIGVLFASSTLWIPWLGFEVWVSVWASGSGFCLASVSTVWLAATPHVKAVDILVP